jgi:hypothetical protein
VGKADPLGFQDLGDLPGPGPHSERRLSASVFHEADFPLFRASHRLLLDLVSSHPEEILGKRNLKVGYTISNSGMGISPNSVHYRQDSLSEDLQAFDSGAPLPVKEGI